MSKTRILSLLLALIMVFGMLPVSAFATDSTDQTAGEPVVTITHVSLDPAKDALGFKAKVEGDSASVTEIGFAFRVNGGAEKLYTLTKTPEDGIFTARVKNILANKGGEATLEAYAFVVVNGETVKSSWQSTSMKQALQAVDGAWFTAGYTQTQKNAVKALCNQYKAQVQPWGLDNIFGGFFGNAGSFVTSSVIDLSTDCGENPSLVLDAHKGTPLYTYIKGLQTQNFSFEATVQVNSILDNEYYPKFGMLVNGQTEMVKFYLDMNPQLQVSAVGAVHQNTGSIDDWAYAATNAAQLNMQTETVDLKLVRDGVDYYYYVNGALVLTGSDLTDEIGTAGFFSFGTELTLTDYTVEADNAVYQEILTQAKTDAETFHQTRDQILAESSSYTMETLALDAKLWNGRGFTFTVLPEELLGQSYIYGKFNTKIDMTVLQSGYLYVLTPPTNHANFPDNILAEGSGFAQVNIPSDWCLANYSNPINTLVYERKVNPGETISIDASWAIVVVSSQRINMYDLLNPNDGNTLEEIAIGQKIWSDEDKAYTFISMPQQLLGKQYVYGSISGGVDVTIGRSGYVYVLTHPRTDPNFAASVDNYNFKRLELPAWTFADYTVKRDTWVYELKVSNGERIQLAPWWGVLIGSETKLDLTGNGVTVGADQLAVIASDSYASVPVALKQQVFSDQAPYYYHTIPYWMAGKSFLCAPLNGGSATVTKAGKLYLIGRNEANSAPYVKLGFTHVMDLDFEPWGGAGLGGGNFAAMGFALYEKDVTLGETVTWGRWGVPLFYSDAQLPAEPITGLQSLSIDQMPTKTTYKLGESFDATGLVVTGIDRNGQKITIDSEHYLLAPAVLSADVPAVSVIVDDKICAIPVIVTDENGKDLTDYSPADMSGFTTQKAPIITGSISLSTVDSIVSTIKKEEADGATGFIVYLTTLAESERTVENLKRIADCTDYPVMALAYGNYSNLEMRLNLWRMAVQAGFDAVDIPMDTYSVSDAASKESYAGMVFASAAPKEVSMDAEVIAQQQAFMAELRAINPELEILISAHVGVAMNQEQGVALAKAMEARGADIAKIVLASTSDLEEALQTNMVLQEELNVPFFYNCAGAASRPFRTAAGLMGTQVVFCCAPYHEINAYVYDYAKDLREFYNTIPELYQEPKAEENTEGVSLSTDYFLKTEDGKYTLSTTGYTDAMVDSVKLDGAVVNAASYRVKGSLSLTAANTWGQARILATADNQNGYVIALEKVGENAYQIFTMSRLNESAWNDWRLISHFETNADRNSIDFELVVDGGKITFLLDDQICYENSRAVMTTSTPQFGASNVATATVSGLAVQVFTDSAQAQSYLATKEQAKYVSRFQTRMDALYNEYIVENNCAGKGGTLIFGDSYMDFWSTWENQTGLTKYENGYNVGIGGSAVKDWLLAYEQLVNPFAPERIILNIGYNDINVWGDNGEEFTKNLQTLFETIHADFPETEIYYIYINPSPSVYANGVYTNWKVEDAINRSKALVAGLDYVTGVDIFDLMTTEDGKNPVAAYYVSDNIHLSAAGYEVLSAHLYELIFKPEYSGFFGTSDGHTTATQFDLSADTGANTGTVTVAAQGTPRGYIHDFNEENFYFETKIHVNGIAATESWPKFGLFVENGGIRHHFYVDMTTALTATTVGRMTVTDGNYDWNNINTATVSGMAFSGEGEYITMGVLKDGKYLHLFVDGKHVLSYESAMTGSAVAGVFGFNTNMTLTEYFTDTTAETLAAKKALLPRYVVTKGDESVMQYDSATDTITINMDGSDVRNQAQLYENGFLVEGNQFAVSGHFKIENTANTGIAASKIEFQVAKNTADFVKLLLYRYETDTTSNNSISVQLADSGNGNAPFGYAQENADGSFSVVDGRPDNLPKGDPYEADYMMIYENGTVYFVLDGKLMYRYEGTFGAMQYYFGVTQYADVTYTNTKATCDAAEVAKLAAPYRAQNGSSLRLTTDHATVNQDAGIYTLDASTVVEETVLKDGVQLNETNYRVSGTLYNNGTADWAQAQVVVKSDDTHAVRFVLERTNTGYYQIFTEKKVGDANWTNWAAVLAPSNQNINRMNFDVVVIKDTIYLIIDGMVYYSAQYAGIFDSSFVTIGGQNVSMTVSNLCGEVFADAAAAQAYADAKPAYQYISNYKSTINNRYERYFGSGVATQTGGTLLLGSSTIDFWGVEKYCGENSWTAKTGLIDHVTGYNVGIGGTCVEDWLYAYDKLIAPFAPSRAIVYVGGNDMAVKGATGADTCAEVITLLEKIHTDFPECEIIYIYTQISPSGFANGAFTNPQYTEYVRLCKEYCNSKDWIRGIEANHLLKTEDGLNCNPNLFYPDNIHMNANGYGVWGDYLYEQIFKDDVKPFFGNVGDYSTTGHVNLSQDNGANTGTATVSENGIAFGYVNDFEEENFYFETKIHVNGIKSTEKYPKFGLFVRGSDSVRHNFYVDMKTDLTATVVGRMTNTNGSDNWSDVNKATISNLAFSGEGEYITMGVLKDGKHLHLFVDGAYILSYESEFTGAAMTGFFGFNTGMTLTEYFTDTSAETLEAKKALLPRYVITKGDASVVSYDAANDAIIVDMDSSKTRNQMELYDNGKRVEGSSFAVTGRMKVENTKSTGGIASKLEFQLAQDTSNFLKMTVYRYGTTSNSVYINTADAGNGSKATGYAYQKTDGSFATQSGHVNNLTAGDPYEVDYKVIFEDGVIYLELEGVLVYKFQSTFTNAIYYFGVTAYADATYTNTQVTYDPDEIAAMTAAYK